MVITDGKRVAWLPKRLYTLGLAAISPSTRATRGFYPGASGLAIASTRAETQMTVLRYVTFPCHTHQHGNGAWYHSVNVTP